MTPAIGPYDPAQVSELVALWNRALGGHLPLSERLWRQNVEDDPNWRPGDCLVARADDGTLAGFVLTRSSRALETQPDLAALRGLGWIMALAVAPEHSGRGIGGELLAAAEARLRQQGMIRCDLGGSIGHFLPGPPADDERALRFWARHGYTPAREVYDLRRSLTDWAPHTLPDAIRLGGWRIAPGQPGQEAAILAFLGQVFPGRWRYHIADTFARGGSAEDVIVLMDPAGAVAGFLASWRPESPLLGPGLHWFPALGPRPGGIGPLGIAPVARGQGLGLALVAAATTILRERGVEDCVIDWVGDHLIDFYGQLGYRKWVTYWRFAPKEIENVR
jgi:ribosomal protein S18 acetylase RimI-like enzyme